jgi:hypothetical protein
MVAAEMIERVDSFERSVMITQSAFMSAYSTE